MTLHDEAGCFGYFGFGGGYEIGKRQRTPQEAARHHGGALYCNERCPHRQACWTAHRKRVRELVPQLMADYDALLAIHGTGPAVVQAFHAKHGIATPDLLMMGGNIEDGIQVGFGERPKDRGAGTLTWPLTTLPARMTES